MTGSIVTVAKRELRSLVDHPTAYVLAVAFLGVSLYLAFRNMYAMGLASLRPLFDLLPILFAVLIPAITMRSLAEERRLRTLDWLLAQPLGEAELVIGKFLGSWAFVLVVLAGTLPTAVGVLFVSEADPGIIAAQYLGAALLAGQLTAIGVWASSITRNQITAFIVAAVIGFVLFLAGLPGIQLGMPPLVGTIVSRLSVVSHFENVARGVADLRDVIYFLTTAALFVFLAIGSVSQARLSPVRRDAARLRAGNAAVALIVLGVNLLGGQIHGRLDLTRERLFTLSDGTREILAGLDDLVQVTLFASSELPPEVQLQLRDVRDLLSDMERRGGGDLVVTELNPDDDEDAEERARSFGIGPLEFNVLRDDEFEVRRGYYGLAVTYAEEQEVFPTIQRTDDLEFQLASTIASMTAETRETVSFVISAGARSSVQLPGLAEMLGDRYDFATSDLSTDSVAAPDPDSVAVLVVAGPTLRLDSLSVSRIEAFIAEGGAALLLLDPIELEPEMLTPIPVTTGLEPFLERHGVEMQDGLVIDLASAERVSVGQQGMFNVIAPYPPWPIALPAGDHITTRGLSALSLGWAGALGIADTTGVVPLFVTTDAGAVHEATGPLFPQQEWERPAEELGVHVVALALEGPAEAETGQAGPGQGRVIVVSDATFSDLEFIQSNPQNVTFLANAIDWLAQDEALIRIRSKDRTPPALVFTSETTRDLLRWGNLAGLPLLFVVFGVFRVTGRRRRAEAKWKEVIQS